MSSLQPFAAKVWSKPAIPAMPRERRERTGITGLRTGAVNLMALINPTEYLSCVVLFHGRDKAKDRTAGPTAAQAETGSLRNVFVLAGFFCAVRTSGSFIAPADANGIAMLRGVGVGTAALLICGRELCPGVFLVALASRVLMPLTDRQVPDPQEELAEAINMPLAITAQALLLTGLIRRLFCLPLP